MSIMIQVMSAYLDRVNLSAQGFYVTNYAGIDWATGKGQPYLYYCYGVGCTEVEIDTLTGDFKVESVLCACRIEIMHVEHSDIMAYVTKVSCDIYTHDSQL